jgi:hypothetical protein
MRFAVGSGNSLSQLVLSSSSLTLNGIDLVGDVTGSATSFTGSLSGNVSGGMNSTVINNGVVTDAMLAGSIDNSKLLQLTASGLVANSATTATTLPTASTICQRDALGSIEANFFEGNLPASTVSTIPASSITNAMLQTISATGLVSNSATTATASNTTATIALRDNTNGTQFGPINTGNIRLTNTTSTSPSYLYGTPAGSGVNLTYNVNTSGTVQNSAEGTGEIILSNEFITLGAGATNTLPTAFLRIGSGGVIETQNSGKFEGNLQSGTLTSCVINSTTNTVTADTLRVLFAAPLTSQTITTSGTWVNLTGYSVNTNDVTYNVFFNLNISIVASYNASIKLRINAPSVSTSLSNPYINASSSGPTTICYTGAVQANVATGSSTISLQIDQSVASSITVLSGYLVAVPYT